MFTVKWERRLVAFIMSMVVAWTIRHPAQIALPYVCAYRLIRICTAAARTVAAHLAQVAKLAWPGQTGHTHTSRFEHG